MSEQRATPPRRPTPVNRGMPPGPHIGGGRVIDQCAGDKKPASASVSSGAATLNAAIGSELPPIFQACCGENNRYDFTKPFRLNGRWYATDGKIVVREQQQINEVFIVEGNVPRADLLAWPKLLPPVQKIALPAVAYAPVACDECKGIGRTNDSECEECDGKKFVDHYTGVKIGTGGIATKFIALLLAHGVTDVVQIDRKVGGEKFYFKTENFEGIIMACRVEVSR